MFGSTDCSFVKMTYYVNPNLILNLCTDVLQSIITLIAHFLSIKSLCCFFGSSTSTNFCFLFSEQYLVISHKFLWFNASFTSFSCSHSIPSLSLSLLSMWFPSYFFLLATKCFVYKNWETKINDGIGGSGEKEKLSYTSLVYHIHSPSHYSLKP